MRGKISTPLGVPLFLCKIFYFSSISAAYRGQNLTKILQKSYKYLTSGCKIFPVDNFWDRWVGGVKRPTNGIKRESSCIKRVRWFSVNCKFFSTSYGWSGEVCNIVQFDRVCVQDIEFWSGFYHFLIILIGLPFSGAGLTPWLCMPYTALVK